MQGPLVAQRGRPIRERCNGSGPIGVRWRDATASLACPASDSWRSGALDPGSAHYFVASSDKTMSFSELEKTLTCGG